MLKKEALFKKVRFTILILALYRLGTYIPIPFVDVYKLSQFVSYASNGLLGMLNTFSGGSISRVSIFGLGIMPYISSSIIMQLLTVSIPQLKDLKEQGEQGRVKINLYIKSLTIIIGIFQGFVLATGFVAMGLYDGSMSIFTFKILCAATMTISTLILIWVGDLCSAYGIGNGISLIIFSGIVAEMPKDISRIYSLVRDGSLSSSSLLLIMFVFVATIVFVVFSERSNRLLLIQYPRQSASPFSRTPMKKDNFLPLKVNNAGVIPPIFASAIMTIPATIVNATGLQDTKIGSFIIAHLVHGDLVFAVIFAALIMFFSFFYNSSIFNVEDVSNNLKKSGVFVPGCRPGESTSKLLSEIMLKLSFIGGLYLIILSMTPELLTPKVGYSVFLGGTSVLIIVNVIVDTIISVQTAFLSNKFQQKAKRYGK